MNSKRARKGHEKKMMFSDGGFGDDLVFKSQAQNEKAAIALNYLSNPENPWIDRQTLATEVLGYSKPQSLWNLFSRSELDTIEREALAARRQRCATISAKVDQALLDRALEGDVKAIKLYYQRYENWSERQILDHAGDAAPIIRIENWNSNA